MNKIYYRTAHEITGEPASCNVYLCQQDAIAEAVHDSPKGEFHVVSCSKWGYSYELVWSNQNSY